MKPGNQPHILNAASNLMGICFVLVTAMKLTHASLTTVADEASLLASVAYMGSCLFSYTSMRSETRETHYERVADILFLLGSLCLFAAVVLFATGWL